jgi:hypothetical protein
MAHFMKIRSTESTFLGCLEFAEFDIYSPLGYLWSAVYFPALASTNLSSESERRKINERILNYERILRNSQTNSEGIVTPLLHFSHIAARWCGESSPVLVAAKYKQAPLRLIKVYLKQNGTNSPQTNLFRAWGPMAGSRETMHWHKPSLEAGKMLLLAENVLRILQQSHTSVAAAPRLAYMSIWDHFLCWGMTLYYNLWRSRKWWGHS